MNALDPRRSPIPVLLLSAAAVSAPARAAEPMKLTWKDAEGLAVERNPRYLAGEARSRSAHKSADSADGRYLPAVRVSEELLHYDSPFDIAFASPGMSGMAPVFRVRDQNTNTFVVSAEEPLLGLLRVHAEARARAYGADAADAQANAGRAFLLEAVRKGYLRYFEAKAVEEIARSSEAELEDQVRLSQAKLKAGVLTEAELLRVRVALANAKQQEIVARAQSEIDRANLIAAIGLRGEEANRELAEPAELLAEGDAPVPELEAAEAQAEKARPDLLARALEAEAAEAAKRAALFALLPDINAVAAYSRLDGQVFAPMNSAFVGVRANWAVFEWGASFHASQAAAEQAEAARLDRASYDSQVGVEVATSISEARAAVNAVRVAKEAIGGAEEAYRETQALVQAGAATTTDLLDAQAALTQAKLNLSRARYELAIARVSIDRITGVLR